MRLFWVDFCRFPGNSCGSCGCGIKHKKKLLINVQNGSRVTAACTYGGVIIPHL